MRAVNSVGASPWSEGMIGAHPSCLRGAVAVGFSFVVTTESGSVENLGDCARERGITALYALHDAQYISYIIDAQSWPECFRGAVSDGFSFVLARGDTVQATVACAQAHGISSLYALEDGAWVSYVVGAPPFVNAAFIDVFSNGVPALTPLLVRQD